MDQILSDLQAAEAALQSALTAVSSQPTPVPVNVSDPAWEAVKSALEANGWSQIITTTPVPEDESAPEDVTEDSNETPEVPTA